MDAAGMLNRAAVLGLTVAALTIGSTLTQPTATVNASVLPDAHVGAPDVGYPNCPGCGSQSVPPASGDVGYPGGGCSGPCGAMDVSIPPSSGDIGYPGGGCGGSCPAQAQPTVTPAEPQQDALLALLPHSGDVGYPSGGCGSGCGVMDVVSPLPSGDVGYPGCPSGCVQDQPDHTLTEPDQVVANSMSPGIATQS